MERFVVLVERVAGIFLAAVALLIFTSVVARDLIGQDIPDSFDFSRYLQGIALFWGIAVATYRNSHINVDLVWELSGERNRRRIDLVATCITTVFLGGMAWMLADRLPSVIRAHQLTSDLKLPMWPFYALAMAGAVAAALVGAIRFLRLARGEAIER